MMTRTADITSFSQHRRHLREHLDQVRVTGRPLYITTNGETDAVVLSPEAFDALAERSDLVESLRVLDASQDAIREGRVRPLNEAVGEIADELGLKLG